MAHITIPNEMISCCNDWIYHCKKTGRDIKKCYVLNDAHKTLLDFIERKNQGNETSFLASIPLEDLYLSLKHVKNALGE